MLNRSKAFTQLLGVLILLIHIATEASANGNKISPSETFGHYVNHEALFYESNVSEITDTVRAGQRGGFSEDEIRIMEQSGSAPVSFSCSNSQSVTTTADSGAGSLRDAIQNACIDGTINFGSSLAGQTITLTSGQIVLNSTLTISNTQASGLTISGNNNSRIFDIRSSGNVTISNLILINGNAGTEFGGAIRVLTDGQLTLLNSTVRDSQARAGGGIRNQGSTTIRFTTIANNSSPNEGGGGINNDTGGIMLIENSTISDNEGLFAGGIANYNGAVLTIINSTISGNKCNAAGSGGGIENFDGEGNLVIRHSTLTNNTCEGSNSGGGIFNNTTPPILSHTIVAGNIGSRPDLSGSFNSNGHNLIGNATGSSGITNGVNGDQVGSGASPIDPMLGSLADNGGPTRTHALLPGSPAIDAGNNSGAPDTDQRGSGFVRILNGTIDIGAYETCFENLSVTNTNDDGFGSLRERILSTCSGGSIDFSSSLAGETITLTSGQIVLSNNITIANTQAPGLTISGNNSTRVIQISGSGHVTLSNLIIANGDAGSSFGGGIRVLNGGQLLLLNSRIENNQALAGGGLRTEGSNTHVTIRNSTISGNNAPNEGGGGINNDVSSQLRIENSSIIANSARWAGGIANYNGGNLLVVNSTFSGNSCTGELSGGAIENYNQSSLPVSTLTVRHSTFTNNSCSGTNSSGGIFNSSQAPLIGHTIIAGNSGPRPDVSGTFNNDGFNLIGISTGSSSFINGSNGNQVGSEASPIDPMLGDLADNGGPTLTHALLPGSLAIDAGNPSANPEALPSDELGNPIDQRGNPRFQGELIDLGAVESDGLSITLTGREGFRMLSTPVEVPLADFLEPIWTQGFDGADVEAGQPNVWTWDPSSDDNSASNWLAVQHINYTLQPGEGVLVYVFENDEYNIPVDNSWPKTLSVEGEPVVLPVAPGINQNPGGFTLLGNPSVSSIAWDDITRNDLDDVVYVWDPNLSADGDYVTWSEGAGDLTDGILRPFQGFFVRSADDGTSPSLEISKTSVPGQFFGKKPGNDQFVSQVSETEKVPSVRLLLTGEGLRNSAWLRFSENGSTGRGRGDALKLQPLSSDYAVLATVVNGHTFLDINHLPINIEQPVHIPLAAKTTQSGTYQIKVTGLNLPAEQKWILHLRDHQTGREIPLTEGQKYSFTLEATAEKLNDKAEPAPVPLKFKNDQSARFTLSIIPEGYSSEELPERVNLAQNYPNPFNPTTVIRYDLPQDSAVKLEVFDIAGRHIATLVDGQVTAGSHTVTFDGQNLSSGVYIYRLQAGGTVLSRQLTLIK